uniref:PS2 n=1 Tax=Corynebacterium glutamicum TaxID=1718 RepID=Q6QUS4_CORGT|nr:PS2 [Corynebacterium glutamicum]
MFNNRIRTAALAGAIAISTAASGVAIPAFAQETGTYNNTGGFNDADGSTIQPAPAVDHSEAELRDATDATGNYLAAFQSGDIEAIVGAYIDAGVDGFDPSEEAIFKAFEAARDEATQQLAFSAETITKTRESVAYALKVDQEATEAYLAYRNALRGAATSINPLIDAANAANRTDGSEIEIYDNIFLASDVFTDGPLLLPAYRELVALQTEVNEDLEWLGEFAIDNDADNYVQRYHIPAVEALKAEIDARLEAIEPLRADSAEKNRLAQKSDVLVRQLFLERATAQRDTLRVVEAIFATAARYVELYESDENVNVEGDTLRNHYVALLPTLFGAAFFNIDILDDADEAAELYYLEWDTDLGTNDEDAAYAEEKRQFALLTYAKVFINGIWQEEVKYVQNLDDGARAEAARVETERLADEAYRAEQLRIAQEAADAQKAIADALAKEAENGNNNGGDNSSDDKETGSSDIGSWGPFAAIAAIISAIAAIFPFLSGIVKF